MINLYNRDCMLALKEMKDNQFDLAIVDPPYGINASKRFSEEEHINNNSMMRLKGHKRKDWDNKIPDKKYFKELIRVSKNQIVWGGNYFIENLTNTRCFIVWDKQNGTNNMADCELAWASFKTSVRMYRGHIFKGIGCTKYHPIHPTQKPVKLYEWILMRYANKGDKILDTHLGSGSIAIACHNLGFDLEGYELDKEYFESANKRLKEHQQQIRMF